MSLIKHKFSYLRFWPVVYGAVLLTAAYISHFAILSNDAFPLRWQAEHLLLSHPESFYNGFFPIGYPLMLRIASAITKNPSLGMMLFQIALAPLYGLLAYRLIREFVSERVTFLALPFVLFSPQVVRATLSPTPDFLASLALLAGLVSFAKAKGMKSVALAGVWIGVGCLFRSHVIAIVAGFTIAILLIETRNLKMLIYFWVGVLPFVIVQGLVQILSGHGFFENLQSFNIWRTMYGIDWNNPPAISHRSAFEIIIQDPLLFLKVYWARVLSTLPFFIIPITLLIFAAKTYRISRSLALITAATLFYLIITTSGGSSRNLTLVIPPIAASAIYLAEMAAGRLLQRKMVVPVLAFITIAIANIALFYYLSGSAKRVEDYADVERVLSVRSRIDANRIYADDFDLYFPNLYFSTPRKSGGWPEIGLPNYAKEFTHVTDTSSAAEHADLVRDSVKWAVFRIPPYDGRGYESIRSDSSLFKLIYRTKLHEIYRVQ